MSRPRDRVPHRMVTQILRMHEAFRIEAAGAHEDGTPLLAVFSSGDGPAILIDNPIHQMLGQNTQTIGGRHGLFLGPRNAQFLLAPPVIAAQPVAHPG